MKTTIVTLIFALAFITTVSAQSRDEKTRADILRVIDDQATAWNRGDIDGFMRGYWNSPEMTFVSGDSVTKGWTPTLERYKRGYNTRAKMGVLSFTELQVTVLSKRSAVVLGRFTLVRDNDKPTGMFTLTFRTFKEGWRIILDHTS